MAPALTSAVRKRRPTETSHEAIELWPAVMMVIPGSQFDYGILDLDVDEGTDLAPMRLWPHDVCHHDLRQDPKVPLALWRHWDLRITNIALSAIEAVAL